MFCDNERLYAIGGADLEYVLDEPCDWLTIDYGSGILWFDRPWSKTNEPGRISMQDSPVTLTAEQPSIPSRRG